MSSILDGIRQHDAAKAALLERLQALNEEAEQAIADWYKGDLSEPVYQQMMRRQREERRSIEVQLKGYGPPRQAFTWLERPSIAGREIHPLAQLFPLIGGVQFDELCVDIKSHGLQQPIVLDDDGRILDGRNRMKACEQMRVNARFVEFSSLGVGCTVEQYIWSANVQRRHLTDDQRAAIALRWKEELAAKAKDRQRQAGGDKQSPKSASQCAFGETAKSGPSHTREALAKMAAVSAHKIRVADEIQRSRPDLIPEVAAGKVTLADAAKQAQPRATKTPELLDYLVVADQCAKTISRLIADALGQIDPKTHGVFIGEINRRMQSIIRARRRPGDGPGVIDVRAEPE